MAIDCMMALFIAIAAIAWYQLMAAQISQYMPVAAPGIRTFGNPSIMFNPNVLGYVMIGAIFVAIDKHLDSELALFISTLMISVSIELIVIALLIGLVYSYRLYRKITHRSLKVTCAICALCVAWLLQYKLISLLDRVALWHSAIELMVYRPFLGTGVGSFHSYVADNLQTFGAGYYHAHNLYLQIGAETGLFGLLTLLLSILLLLRSMQGDMARGYIVASLCISLTDFVYTVSSTVTLTLGTILILSSRVRDYWISEQC